MTKNDLAISKGYLQLLERLKNQRLTALIAGILVFGFLSFLSAGTLIETHWFTFILFSIVSGCWFMLLGRLVLWIHFLRPHVKNRNRPQKTLKTYPIGNALKKTKQAIFVFCAMTSFLLLNFFISLIQQFNTHSPVYFFSWSNWFMQIPLSLFLGLMTFVIIVNFTSLVLRMNIFNSSPRNKSSNSLEYLSEYTSLPHHQKFSENEHNLAKEMQENWDHDPINPASAEYQSTYRRWFHHD